MAEKKVVKKTTKVAKPAKVDNSALAKDALATKLTELKKQAMEQRFAHSSGQLPKTHVIRKTRREIARVKTEMNKKGN